MFIKNIKLSDFRNIKNTDISPNKNLNILFGENAQGKTNFLEAIYFCAIARSFRTNYEKDLINHNQKSLFINTLVCSDTGESNIDIEINKEGRRIKVNSFPVKKLGELYGNLYAALFSPEDLQLIKAGPHIRRRFIDIELCQLYPRYYHSLQFYYKILKQRNNLLKEILKSKKNIDTLGIWDEQLVHYGSIIIQFRERFIEELSDLSSIYQKEISDYKEGLKIIYKSNTNPINFMEKLKKSRENDIFRGQTSVGVHKDDITFMINNKDARDFASQGQQRTIVLALKIAQITLLEKEKGEYPLLLLDDVLSELDTNRRSYLLSNIKNVQTFITTTGESIEKDLKGDISLFEVKEGEIFEVG